MMDSQPTAELIATATRQQQVGNLSDAERIYGDVLRQHPSHCDALNLLGTLRIAQSRCDEAVELIQAAIKQKPAFFRAHFNLGLAFSQLGRHREAIASYTRAIALRPDYYQAFNSRGNAFLELNRGQEAIASYERAINCNPHYAEANYNLGVALGRFGEYDAAVQKLDRALQLDRQSAKTWHQKGNVLVAARRYAEALDSYEQALSINANDPHVLCHRGNALTELNRKAEALDSYDRALGLLPAMLEARVNRGALLSSLHRFAEASDDFATVSASSGQNPHVHVARGQMFVQQHRYSDALSAFEIALGILPDFVNAIICRGTALAKLNRIDAAIECFSTALSIKPKSTEALINLAVAFSSVKRYDAAIDAYERLLALPEKWPGVLGPYLFAKMCACDWRQLESIRERVQERADVADAEIDPFVYLNACSDPGKQLVRARKFTAAKLPPDIRELWTGTYELKTKLRIAYLSANFNQHPVSDTIVELLELHDRTRFTVIGVSFGLDDQSAIRKRIGAACDEFYDVSERSDSEAAELLRAHGIDIAVDLMGHTAESRQNILAYRPAPVQVSYLGYPGTTGAPFIDYLVADSIVVPPDLEDCYSEAIARLPDCYLPIDSTRSVASTIPTRADERLPEQGFVFCCFNNHYKISASIFAVWMSLLSKVEGSVLWLLGGNAIAEKNLREEARNHGVDPKRLIFAARAERLEDHLARHRLASLFLDTPEYNAHSTARDALWAELPVITCIGKSFASRVAASLLQSLQMPELITDNLSEYARLAAALATDSQMFLRIREKLREKRVTTRLFDVDSFRRHLEVAYTTMIERQVQGQPHSSFSVAVPQLD